MDHKSIPVESLGEKTLAFLPEPARRIRPAGFGMDRLPILYKYLNNVLNHMTVVLSVAISFVSKACAMVARLRNFHELNSPLLSHSCQHLLENGATG
jgi:hypothetical protein